MRGRCEIIYAGTHSNNGQSRQSQSRQSAALGTTRDERKGCNPKHPNQEAEEDKGQYSSPPSVSVSVSRSQLVNFSSFREIKL